MAEPQEEGDARGEEDLALDEEEEGAESEDELLDEEAVAEGEEEEDVFSLLGESSEDEEQHEMYRQYLELIKEIDAQNALIEDLKARLTALDNERCQTRAVAKEAKSLRICMRQEKCKLDVMATRAIQLQNCGSHRHYRELNLAMTIDEDSAWDEPHCSFLYDSDIQNRRDDSDESDDSDDMCR